jgi:hypothetical protein
MFKSDDEYECSAEKDSIDRSMKLEHNQGRFGEEIEPLRGGEVKSSKE